MHNLGFIHLKKSSIHEEELLTDLWKLLGGTNENSIKAENLLTTLAAVMNLQVQDVLMPHLKGQNYEDHYKVGALCYDSINNLHFSSEEEIFKVH